MIRLIAALALLAAPAAAQQVRDCDTWEAGARNVVWDDPPRTFANGAIRLVALDTEEPACCSYHLLVLFPDPEIGYQSCALVSGPSGSIGLGGISLRDAAARYDAAVGLTVTIPTGRYDGEKTVPDTLTVTIDQALGVVTAY